MSEVRSALVWEKGDVGVSKLTVTLQEVKVCGKNLVMALVCEGEEGGSCSPLPAGYLCESMVGWFYNEMAPLCKQRSELTPQKLEGLIRKQWKCAVGEWEEYARKKTCNAGVRFGGILLFGSSFVAFGNIPVYVLNRRFNKPRRKNILSVGGDVVFLCGEVGSFLSFYLENEAMSEGLKEGEVVASLYTDGLMKEKKLEKRISELGKVVVQRIQGKSVGAVILEVEP